MSILADAPGTPFVTRVSIGGDGLRVAVKDNIDIEGLPTTAGSRAFLGRPPAAKSASVVRRLVESGFKIVGKTKLHELAFGVTGLNDAFGTPINPTFPDLIPGGSSSGSAAAVAAGFADIAIGTDTGGSIRIPAACCGVFGFKPTFGRLPRDGVVPSASSLDCVGVFARTVDAIEVAMKALDEHYERKEFDHIKIGVVECEGASEIIQAVRAALSLCGATLENKSLSYLEAAFSAGLTVIAHETAEAFMDLIDSPLVAEDVAARLRNGAIVSPDELRMAELVRHRFREELEEVFNHVDVLALPTIADFPPELKDAKTDRSAVSLTKNVRPFNLSGNPAIAIPLPPIGGRPVSLQLVGPLGGDEMVCAVARRIEAVGAA